MVIETAEGFFAEWSPSNVDLSLATNEQGDGRLYTCTGSEDVLLGPCL